MGSEEEDEVQYEDVERSIIELARLAPWMMMVVTCLTGDDTGGVRRWKLYIWAFAKYRPILKEQICGTLYSYVDKWEPEDLYISEQSNLQSSIGAGVSEQDVFSKTYTECVPVHLPSMKQTFLEVSRKWFTYYVGASSVWFMTAK